MAYHPDAIFPNMPMPERLDPQQLIGHRLVLRSPTVADGDTYNPLQHQAAAYYRVHVSGSDPEEGMFEIQKALKATTQFENDPEAIAEITAEAEADRALVLDSCRGEAEKDLGLKYLSLIVGNGHGLEKEVFLWPEQAFQYDRFLAGDGSHIQRTEDGWVGKYTSIGASARHA